DLQLGKDARQEAFRVALQRLFDAHKFNSIDSGGKGCGHWSIVQSMARSVHASRVTHSSREGATPAARCLPTNGAAAFRVGRPSTKLVCSRDNRHKPHYWRRPRGLRAPNAREG